MTLWFFCSDKNSYSSLSREFRGCSGGGRRYWTSYLEKQIYSKETKRYRLQSWYILSSFAYENPNTIHYLWRVLHVDAWQSGAEHKI